MNTDPLPGLMSWLLAASLHASLAALVILSLQKALLHRLPARWRFGLWLPFVLILLLPVRPESPLSVERLWSSLTMDSSAVMAGQPVASPVGVPGGTGASAPLVPDGKSSGPDGWSIAGIIWLTGFAAVTGVGFAAYRRQMRGIRTQAREVAPALRAGVEIAAGEVALKRRPDIICSRAVRSPAVTGPWRPVLLLPADFAENTPPSEAALILRHEMLHLKHGDTAWDALFWLLNAAHWFNPLIWFAFIRLRSDREMARDAGLLAEAGHEERAAYGGALLRLQLPPGAALFQAGFVGLVNGGRAMRRRMAGLAHHRRISNGWHIAGALLAALILFTVGASADAKKPASAAAATPENAVIAKSKTLMLERIRFEDASIQEVLDYVRRKSIEADGKETDPSKKGVDLILVNSAQSQNAKVTFDLKNVSVYDVLSLVAKQVGFMIGPDPTGAAIMIALPSEFAETAPAPQPGTTSPVSALAAKLIVARCQFQDATVEQAAAYIERESKRLDPAGKGVRIKVAPEAGKGRLVTLQLRSVRLLNLTQIVAEQSGLELKDDGTALVFVPRAIKK